MRVRIKSTGDEPDDASESVYDLLIHIKVFDDEIKFESDRRSCKLRSGASCARALASVIILV